MCFWSRALGSPYAPGPGDCGGAPAPQVKHELKMLRELLAAEQRKLDALKPKQGEANRDELSLKLAELGRAKS